MSHLCPQCRGVFSGEERCRERFDLGQVKEMEQPAYGAVHHLSVPCYLLQHNVYSQRGWLEVRKLLSRFVNDGWTPAMARRAIQAQATSRRTWNLTRGAKLPGVEQIAWSFTIADVRLGRAEDYCADVLTWARRVLADSEELVRSVEAAGGRG